MSKPIEIQNPSFYRHGEPKTRTRARLQQMIEIGLQEVGDADFGIDGLVLGIYIERVWSYSEADWTKYMNWVISVRDRTDFREFEIRALSLKQPFAELMLHGKIETRTWSTKYRGLVLICASVAPYSGTEIYKISGMRQFDRIFATISKRRATANQGHAIAIGELVDCRPMQPEDEDACFVEYRENLYCHVYKNVKPIDPIAWKGSQGWKTLIAEQKEKIFYSINAIH